MKATTASFPNCFPTKFCISTPPKNQTSTFYHPINYGAQMKLGLRTVIAALLALVCAGTAADASSLVATINAKLARWVHPTGKCGFGTERLATFYWQGRRTANGEHFHPDGLTAAHRTLPFGTTLNITNPHNGRSVTVRINDRGPATHAWIDLSRGAARHLGLTQSSYICVN